MTEYTKQCHNVLPSKDMRHALPCSRLSDRHGNNEKLRRVTILRLQRTDRPSRAGLQTAAATEITPSICETRLWRNRRVQQQSYAVTRVLRSQHLA